MCGKKRAWQIERCVLLQSGEFGLGTACMDILRLVRLSNLNIQPFLLVTNNHGKWNAADHYSCLLVTIHLQLCWERSKCECLLDWKGLCNACTQTALHIVPSLPAQKKLSQNFLLALSLCSLNTWVYKVFTASSVTLVRKQSILGPFFLPHGLGTQEEWHCCFNLSWGTISAAAK